jgi:monoamine oxidase
MCSAKRRAGKDRQSGRRKPDGQVIVIGAGVAGLAAAAVLAERGIRFSILEARDRIGGRLWTRHPASLTVPVELGAEFVHGEAAEVTEIVEREGLRLVDIAGRRWRSKGGALRLLDDFWERLDRVMRRLDDEREPDRTFADALEKNRSLDDEDRALAMQYVSGFHAANPGIISERALADGGSPRGEVRERRIGRVVEGYDSVVDALAARVRGKIRLGAVVREIRWRPGAVSVVIAGRRPKTITGRAVIVTVPLGVLAAAEGERGAIAFDPPLPPSTRSAIGSLTMGNVTRIALEFDEPFWISQRFASHVGDERLDTMAFLHGTSDVDIPVWWTTYPIRSPLLIGWCGGPRALELASLSSMALEATALRSLAELLSMDVKTLRTHLVAVRTHDWINDPFSRGAYSYARVGGSEAAKRLARPIERTLYFAGEAADSDGRNGTVHGAIGSGRKTAELAARAPSLRR